MNNTRNETDQAEIKSFGVCYQGKCYGRNTFKSMHSTWVILGAHTSADFYNIPMQILQVGSLPMPISSIIEVRRLSWKFADLKLIMEHCRFEMRMISNEISLSQVE